MHNCGIHTPPIGSVVTIQRFPDTRWIVCDGWFTYDGTQQNGIYLKSIPAGTTIPLTTEDMMGLYVVSAGCHPGHTPCHPHMPPPPHPICPPMQNPIEDYLPGVNYVEGQLVWLTAGDIYQVAKDYTSCSSKPSSEENLMEDVVLGNLIPIGNSDSGGCECQEPDRIPELSIDSMFE